jgi:glucosamine-6-phosphate deaminase
MRYFETETYAEACQLAADMIMEQIQEKPESVLGLATGSTPIGIYDIIAKAVAEGELDVSKLTTFNLDEYVNLPVTDPNSYLYFMKENLFDRIGLSAEAYNIPNGNAADIEAECVRYEEAIKAAGGIDLQLLGLGLNGHIAFNEPGTPLDAVTHQVELTESTRVANSRFFASMDEVPTHAVTMGLKTICEARSIVLMACGEAKYDILQAAMNGPVTDEVPASILQQHPDLTVIFSRNN